MKKLCLYIFFAASSADESMWDDKLDTLLEGALHAIHYITLVLHSLVCITKLILLLLFNETPQKEKKNYALVKRATKRRNKC